MAYTRSGLTPSTAIFIIVFTIMLLFPKFEDPDFYWHLKTGELIVTTAQLPWHDVFTYTNSGNAWVLSEWLSQVIFYLLYQQTGLTGVEVVFTKLHTVDLQAGDVLEPVAALVRLGNRVQDERGVVGLVGPVDGREGGGYRDFVVVWDFEVHGRDLGAAGNGRDTNIACV